MLGRYPGAQAICMIRDPRAVVASYRDWKNQGGFDFESDPGHREALEEDHARARRSYNIVLMSLLWRSTVAAAMDARDRFGPGRVRVQHYEQLTEDSEGCARGICEWLGVGYEPAMLNVPMHNSSFSSFQRQAGISKDPVRRWRTTLSAGEIAIVQSVSGRVMVRAGYALERVPRRPLLVAWNWAKLPAAGLRALLVNRHRMGDIPAYLLRRLRLAGSGRA